MFDLLPKNEGKILKKWKKPVDISGLGWGHYYADYMNSIEILLKEDSFQGPRIKSLLFLVRHALEVGLKQNIIMLRGYLEKKEEAKPIHDLGRLYDQFLNLFKDVEKEFKLSKSTTKPFYTYNEKLKNLKSIFNTLDEGSMSFRYPKDQTGNNFFVYGQQIDMPDIIKSLLQVNEMFMALHDVIDNDPGMFEYKMNEEFEKEISYYMNYEYL